VYFALNQSPAITTSLYRGVTIRHSSPAMYRGVNDYIEALGLQTYGIERHDPHAVVRRPSFKFQPVIDLYKRELPALYGRLLRDEGTLLDRHDPNLFDKELDDILISLGERIWPRPGNGSRVHLRKPDPSTRYPDHLIYPRDASTWAFLPCFICLALTNVLQDKEQHAQHHTE